MTFNKNQSCLLGIVLACAVSYCSGQALHRESTTNMQNAVACDATAGLNASARDPGELELIEDPQTPILSVQSPGAEQITHGFESGRVIKQNGRYYLFITEMPTKQLERDVDTTLALWTSPDLEHWTRASTLFQSDGDFTGKSARASLWSPLPVYNDEEGRWDLFYVAYYSMPDKPALHLAAFAGRIWRAVSTVPGKQGLSGPYRDAGVVMAPGAASDNWEGLQGVDSFFPYRAQGRWYSFYGTCHTENNPVSSWIVGLADSQSLAGKWRRCSATNPVPIETRYIENPIVTKLPNGLYVAVYDTILDDFSIGYALSPDGVHWHRGRSLRVRDKKGIVVITPLGLVAEGDGTYTLLYTGWKTVPGTGLVESVFRTRVRYVAY